MDAATTRIPQALIAGKYRLGTRLGEGGMGVVHAATDTVTGRAVALKITPPLDGRFAQRFLREARTLARIEHPNVVPLYDAGILPDGRGYLAQKLLAGEDLATCLDGCGILTVSESLDIVCGVLAGLCAVHRAGAVHRDVKPANVFLAKDPVRGMVPTLLDFGIAYVDGSRATVVGQLVGTPGSMSPEQAAGGNVDARADVFAAGLLLLECLTGSNPLVGASMPDAIVRAMDPARHLGTYLTLVRGRCGAPLADALATMLATDPDARPRTAAAALGLLLEAAQATLPAGAVARLRLTTAPFLAAPSEHSRVRPTPLARGLEGWARVRPWLSRAVVLAAVVGAAAAWIDSRVARQPVATPAARVAALPSKAPAPTPPAVVTAPAPLVLSTPVSAPVAHVASARPVARSRARQATAVPVSVPAPPAVGARGAPILAP